MTPRDLQARIGAAHTVATELEAIIRAEGRPAYAWQQQMRLVAADLAVTDATSAEVLAAARDRFDGMYRGPRNFTEFHLWRDDETERLTANRRLTALIEQLRGLLHDD